MSESLNAQRIFIIGASGSGKTSLARALGERLGIPVHNLDDLTMDPRPGRQPLPEVQRRLAVDRIVASERWIAEGIHLGWTDPLLEAADLVIWLDHVSWPRASAAIIRRFVSQASPAPGGAEPAVSRSATAHRLANLSHKVVQCRSAEQVRTLAAALTTKSQSGLDPAADRGG
jgi:adenylate kinase family enzyme